MICLIQSITWSEMMKSIAMGLTEEEKASAFDAFCFSNTYFFTDRADSRSPFFNTRKRSMKISPDGDYFAKNLVKTSLKFLRSI